MNREVRIRLASNGQGLWHRIVDAVSNTEIDDIKLSGIFLEPEGFATAYLVHLNNTVERASVVGFDVVEVAG